MPAPVSEAVAVALALASAPERADRVRASRLPEGVLDVIRVAAGDAPLAADLAERAGISTRDVEEACLHFAHAVMFHPDANHFQVLGVSPDADETQIKQHFRWLLKWLHPDRDPEGWVSSYAERVNRAWSHLRRSDRRTAYRDELGSLPLLESPSLDELVSTAPRPGIPPLQMARSRRLSSRWLTAVPSILVGLIVVAAAGLFAAHRAGESMLAREASRVAGNDAAKATVTDEMTPAVVESRAVPHSEQSINTEADAADPTATAPPPASEPRVVVRTEPPAVEPEIDQSPPQSIPSAPPSSAPIAARAADPAPPQSTLARSLESAGPGQPSRATVAVAAVDDRPDASVARSTQAPAAAIARSTPLASVAPAAGEGRPEVATPAPVLADAANARAVVETVDPEPQPIIAAVARKAPMEPSSGGVLPTKEPLVSTTPAPEVETEKQRAVRDLLNRFSSAYRTGDSRGLVVLFVPNAVTPDGNLLDFNDGYGEVVARSSRRSLEFLDLTMRPTAGGVEAVGRFEWAMGEARTGAVEAKAGDARVVVAFEGGRPLIAALEF